MIDLTGVWQFRKQGDSDSQKATVPGCNYADLLKLGAIPDPYIGKNEKDVYWVAKENWEYLRDFEVDEATLACDSVTLCCDMLDTICDVFVNDKLVGKGNNCHLGYRFELKGTLKSGINTIKILFYSPVQYVSDMYDKVKTPFNNLVQKGAQHIRKPECHFGWDWGATIPISGITGDIRIESRNKARLSEVKVKQEHFDGKVRLSVDAEYKRLSDGNAEYKIVVTAPDGGKQTAEGGLNGAVCAEFSIEKPQLWWTYEYSQTAEQPLYTVEVFLLSDGAEVDKVTKRIGLRTLKIDREKDAYGENFRFILNGVPMFAKGANLIPSDCIITDFDSEKLKYYMDAVRFSNMNILRIWGGGYYGSDAIYDMCDRYGILIWQDFQFACQAYPLFLDDFLENLQKEVDYNVKRIRHHASLAIWCGNNEIESGYLGWSIFRKFVNATEKYFYDILPKQLAKLDEVTPYIPSSPFGDAPFKGCDRDDIGDTHLWAVWHGLQEMQYYRKRLTRFCSEFGFESLPDIKTIEKFAKKEDYSLGSPVFTAHQKCTSGNMKMKYYIASRFLLPKKFVDYVYLSQICQEECVRDATEHWRRNKGRCNGAIFWQLNDCWPVCSWASIDYYGNFKALQYSAGRFNAPISVSLEDGKESVGVYVFNDSLSALDAEVNYSIMDFDGNTLFSKTLPVAVEANKVAKLDELSLKTIGSKRLLKKCVMAAKLIKNGKLLSQKTLLFAKEMDIKLPKSEVSAAYTVQGDVGTITLSSKKYVRLMQVSSTTSTLPFSDNFFDILPNEAVVITQKVPYGTTAEQFAATIKLFSAVDVTPAFGGKLGNFFARLKVLLRPDVLGKYMAYKHVL